LGAKSPSMPGLDVMPGDWDKYGEIVQIDTFADRKEKGVDDFEGI